MPTDRPTIPLLREPIPATVEYGGRRWTGRLLSRGPHEAVLETTLRTTIGSIAIVRLLSAESGAEWLTLECAVRAVMAPPSPRDGASTYLVRWRWAYCPDGVDPLAERVAHLNGLRVYDLTPARLLSLEHGGLYAFDPSALRYAVRTLERAFAPVDRARTAARDAATPDGSRRAHRGADPVAQTTVRLHRPFTRLRAHQRVRVDLPCRYVVGGAELSGWLRDVSRGGAFVTTRWTFPSPGARVIVSFTTSLAGHRVRFLLTGATRRVNEDASDGSPPGFGVAVESVVDGECGRAFQRYLDLLLRSTDEEEAAPEVASAAPDAPPA